MSVAVFSIILVPNYGISVGIPILLVGAACTGISIFCFYTMYTVPECRPETNVIGDAPHRRGVNYSGDGVHEMTSGHSEGVTIPTRLHNEDIDREEEDKANLKPLLKA